MLSIRAFPLGESRISTNELVHVPAHLAVVWVPLVACQQCLRRLTGSTGGQATSGTHAAGPRPEGEHGNGKRLIPIPNGNPPATHPGLVRAAHRGDALASANRARVSSAK